ncbi:D-alanyl-D-alanine carboxypeptidase/D-alanyl-D-alanine endopeptidase [Nocardioides aequoreus]|uniref:D-alanyl-D-alanine carboxypeptidase/D-alanyl-D-alanine endopeptidase n=1 Tax=Nocardioides aequoreus TaxID=397278 RepID=UPI00069002FB|nr:D-alanyl-D-alanine carboxypeptidase/D-alanyl-D-alanine-endopeptidase [Nocardioides aequoreus]
MARDQRHSRRRRRVLGWLAELVVLALLAFAVAAYHYDLGERWFGWGPVDPLAEPAAVLPPVGLRLPELPAAPAVAPAEDAVAPAPGAVAAALRPQLRGELGEELGDHYAVLVTDLASGEEAFSAGAARTIPASTTKILTAVAALEALAPTDRFATTVRWLPGQRRLVLVGGGDPYLERSPADAEGLYPERADLATLARRTAQALRAEGIDLAGLRLGFDDSLFTGPAVNPTWPDRYLDDITSGVSALWVDQAELEEGVGFAEDPALQAAGVFAAALERAGVEVAGEPRRRAAPDDAAEVARVEGAPVGEVVERMLATSDNQAADVLAHHVGLAERGEGSFVAGAAATLDVVRRLGVPARGDRLLDGSGLSRRNALSARTLAATLRVAASPEHPRLRHAVTGLPVAGFSGSLAARLDDGPQDALGRVRAKTGTLTSVHGLAGVVDTADGARMAFVAITDSAPADGELDAQLRVDALAAALAACRCGVGS